MKCLICNKDCKSSAALAKHIHSKHNFITKNYYDKYIKSESEGICPVDRKETPFLSLTKGYQKHCCYACAQRDTNTYNIFRNNNPQKNENSRNKTKQTNLERYGVPYTVQSKLIREKSKQTNLLRYGVENAYQQKDVQQKARINSHTSDANKRRKDSIMEKVHQIAIENDCTYIQDVLAKTRSSGWYQADIVKPICINNHLFIRNCDLQTVFDYDTNMFRTISHTEKYIVKSIKSVYSSKIIENSRKIIYPKELDIYLPDLKLAIEYNGLYFHSDLAGTENDYHLQKSIMCRDKNIRLIHIYEFENLDQQIKLLLDLISGIDNYPKEDFNKNNLIDIIPEPTIIYTDKRLNIYGAGPLY